LVVNGITVLLELPFQNFPSLAFTSESGGLYRMPFTQEDMDAPAWFGHQMNQIGTGFSVSPSMVRCQIHFGKLKGFDKVA
jgi:hypothetical protein